MRKLAMGPAMSRMAEVIERQARQLSRFIADLLHGVRRGGPSTVPITPRDNDVGVVLDYALDVASAALRAPAGKGHERAHIVLQARCVCTIPHPYHLGRHWLGRSALDAHSTAARVVTERLSLCPLGRGFRPLCRGPCRTVDNTFNLAGPIATVRIAKAAFAAWLPRGSTSVFGDRHRRFVIALSYLRILKAVQNGP